MGNSVIEETINEDSKVSGYLQKAIKEDLESMFEVIETTIKRILASVTPETHNINVNVQ